MPSINKFSIPKPRRVRSHTCTRPLRADDSHCQMGSPDLNLLLSLPSSSLYLLCQHTDNQDTHTHKKNTGRLLKFFESLPCHPLPYLTLRAHTHVLVANYNMVSNDPASSASEMECSSKTLNCNLPCTKSISIWSRIKGIPRVARWRVRSAASLHRPSRAWIHTTKTGTAERCAVPLILFPDHKENYICSDN